MGCLNFVRRKLLFIISALILVFIAEKGFCNDWNTMYFDQNEFIKLMAFDPTHAYRDFVPDAPIPAPEHYQMLDDIGINGIITGIKVSGGPIGHECTAAFDPNINTPKIPIICGSPRDPNNVWYLPNDPIGQQGYDEGYLHYYSEAIAIKKRLGEWNFTNPITQLGDHPVRPIEVAHIVPPYYGSWWNGDPKVVGDPRDVLVGDQLYNMPTEKLIGGTYIPNFYGSGNDFNSRLCERLNGWAENEDDHPVKIRLKLRLEDYTPGIPENPSLPASSDILFKVKIWESDMSGPDSSADPDVIYSYSINSLCDTIFQIPPPPPEQKRYNLEDYNWLQLPTVNYNSLQDGERRQLNIQFYIRNTSYLTDFYHVSILIDEIEVFDAAGEEIIKPK